MNPLQEQLIDDIRAAFAEAIDLVKNNEQLSVADFYVCIKSDELLLVICDDAENVIVQASLDEWEALKESDSPNELMVKVLKEALDNAVMTEHFESLPLFAPFSVLLVNESHEMISEIVTIDKDNFYIDGDLFESIDRELDDFLEKLMEDCN